MPRTKHLYILIIFTVAILLCILFLLVQKDGEIEKYSELDTLPEPIHMGATVVESTDQKTRRESLVARVTERLKDSLKNTQEEIVETSETETLTEENIQFVKVPRKGAVYSCDGNELFHSEIVRTWGIPDIRTAEGARIFSYVSETSNGTTSLSIVQVYENPLIARGPSCLIKDAVGISLSGDVLYTGIPYTGTRVKGGDGLIGYAFDGFGIYETHGDGEVITEDMLDMCHGHIHTVVWDGVPVSTYHYHMTDTFPYTVSCFMGTVLEQL